jgi:predicted ATPase
LSPRSQQALKATTLLRLDATRLAAPSYSDKPVPALERDGGGLASVLAFLTVNQPEAFQKLQEHLRAVIPAVRRIRGERRPIKRVETKIVSIGAQNVEVQEQKEYVGDAWIVDFDGAPGIPSDLVSSGTLMVTGLLAAILGPGTPRLLLLDDIEHGLHPKAQRDLMQLLHKLLEEQPDLQIIATSHSPYLLDGLDPKEIRITYAADGVSYCAPLAAHPDFERWKEEMSPGEFWSAVGESWAKDPPAAGTT